MEEKIKPTTALYNLKGQTNVVIIDDPDSDSKYTFYICGLADDKDDFFGTIFMLDDEMLVKLRKLINEHIGVC